MTSKSDRAQDNLRLVYRKHADVAKLREQFFVEYDSNGGNATQAAIKIGVSPGLARRWAIKRAAGIAIRAPQQAVSAPIPSAKLQTQKTDPVGSDLRNYEVFIVTSVFRGAATHSAFYGSIKAASKRWNGKILACPIEVKKAGHLGFDIDEDHLFSSSVELFKGLYLANNLKTPITAGRPLNQKEVYAKRRSLLLPSGQQEMRTLPVIDGIAPAMWTTMTLSLPTGCYPDSATGQMATAHHKIGALVVELGENHFHIRELLCDEQGGFFDIDEYHTEHQVIKGTRAELLAPGDSHRAIADPGVDEATYYGEDSIMKVTRPKRLTLDDLLDFFSKNHHDEGNDLIQAAKQIIGVSNVEAECKQAVEFVASMKELIDDIEVIIKDSNHNAALAKSFQKFDHLKDPVNAAFYAEMLGKMLRRISKTPAGPDIPDPFEIYFEEGDHGCHGKLPKLMFTSNKKPLVIGGVENGQHGDKGLNGAKGSMMGFSKFCQKINVGHGHSPMTWRDVCISGTSSILKPGYAAGMSTWAHAHILQHPQGLRQMLFIKGKEWRKKDRPLLF